jgi:hypothetical protein
MARLIAASLISSLFLGEFERKPDRKIAQLAKVIQQRSFLRIWTTQKRRTAKIFRRPVIAL